MKTDQRPLLAALLLLSASCNDASTLADSGSSAGETTTTATTSIDPTTGTTSASTVADASGDTSTGLASSSTSTSGGPGSSGDESSTTEPPRVTDFRRCAIELACDQTIVDEPKRSCNITVTEADGYVVYDGAGGLENRGRSSQGWPKHQYGLELWEHANLELVSPGATWRYNDGPTAGGADWNTSAFDDTDWAEGAAPLGYGVLGPEGWATVAQIPNATTIGYGPNAGNKYITAWYRHSFEVADAATLDPVVLHVRADDGVAVYVNGTEIARFNLPPGPLDATTPASATLDSLDEIEFVNARVPAGLLVDGTNVVAVEVHQASAMSSDTTLDLSLSTDPPSAAVDFFEFGDESDWILSGMYFDLSLYRNKLMYDLFEAFAPDTNYGPQTQYCDVTLDGDWRGIYLLSEEIGRDADRVDIQAQLGNGESFIFKSDVTQTWIVTNGIGWQLVYPKPDALTPAVAAGLTASMTAFGNATAGVGDIWELVDMPTLVDWVLLQEFSNNGDAYYSSIHIYKDVGGKIVFVPWDFDIGLGGGCNPTDGWLYRYDGHWLNVMAADPEFRAALVARWTELRETVLSQESFDAQLAGYVETMTPETIEDNFERWPQDQIIGGDDWVLPFRESCPTATWDEEHAYVQAWITARLSWMDANIGTFQ